MKKVKSRLGIQQVPLFLAVAFLLEWHPLALSAQEEELAITRALSSPEELWRFVTAPETPYRDRMTAAGQAKGVIPLSWLQRILEAQQKLSAELSLHNWGLERNPNEAQPILGNYPLYRKGESHERTRSLLGHRFDLPRKPQPYPSSERRMPWPWQVTKALDRVFYVLLPANEKARRGLSGPSSMAESGASDNEEAERWFEAVMAMRCTTDTEAGYLFQASRAARHYKTLSIMAVWRNIVFNPRFPKTGGQIALELSTACQLWSSPYLVCQALAAEILERSENERHQELALSYLRSYRLRGYPGKTTELPMMAGLTLGASRFVLGPGLKTDWDRLHMARILADTLDDPPITTTGSADPGSPGGREQLAAFRSWFKSSEPILERKAAAERQGLSGLYEELSAVTKCSE